MLSDVIYATIGNALALIDSAQVRRSIAPLTSGSLLLVGASSVASFAGSAQGSTPVWLATSSTFVDSIRAWALGVTTTAGQVLENTSTATAGAQQCSPAMVLAGRGHATTPVNSQRVACYLDVLPVQGAAAPTGTLQVKWAIAAGAPGTAAVTLTSTGILMTAGGMISNSYVQGQYVSIAAGTAAFATGLGTICPVISSTAATPLGFMHNSRTDGANNIVCFINYIRGAAIANATTMRLLSFGVTLDTVPNCTELASIRCNGDLYICQGATGQGEGFGSVFELTTIAAAPFTDTTIQVPAGAKVLSVTGRVTVEPPNTATMDLGIAGATTRFATGISTDAGTTFLGTADTAFTVYPAAISVRCTPNASPSSNAGRIRFVINYYLPIAPTS